MADTHPTWLPFARANLFRNPFGELSRQDRIRATVVNRNLWQDKLAQDHVALQFMGDCGRGKTTHLLALYDAFPDAAFVYLRQGKPVRRVPLGTPLFIDEAQRLPRRLLREVSERGVPLVLGTHRDLSWRLRRRGYTVETVEVSQQATPAHLHKIFNRRIHLARLGTGPTPFISMPEVEQLIAAHGTDIRAMEHSLYDTFQTRQGEISAKM